MERATELERAVLALVPPPPAPVTPTKRVPASAITFVDLETTGLEFRKHEILEIGVIRADARTLEIVAQCEVRVCPERLENASPEALAIAGYSLADWVEASTLEVALCRVAPLFEGALVAGHNVGFDWAFLEEAFRREELPLPEVDYHRLDTASLAWPLVASGELTSLSLNSVAAHFGLERPSPHRALADARCSLEVARRLSHRMRQASPVGRLKRVYVCHPFSDGPAANIGRVHRISRALIAEGVLPIAPHLYLPQLVDEATQRERALNLCVELLGTCDEVRVFGGRITSGMERELQYAARHGIPVRFEGRTPA
ncbi:MAG: 3'-5' exonuclease [Myxococcales bacterium]|nr:3'-5' exonuclease [Myxococcales bacterium]